MIQTESRSGMSWVTYDIVIRLQGKFKGKNKGFNHLGGYLIYPRINMWNEIVIHNDYKRQVVYKSIEEFLQDWTDLKPYQNNIHAIKFLENLKQS